jgi:hypothetical protein
MLTSDSLFAMCFPTPKIPVAVLPERIPSAPGEFWQRRSARPFLKIFIEIPKA